MSGKITVALAGLGSRGKDVYAQAAKLYPEKMEIVAIADIDPVKVEMVAKEFGISKERCYASAEEMLQEEKLADVMFITTQDRQHVGHAIPALRKGYHLLLEKPISPDLDARLFYSTHFDKTMKVGAAVVAARRGGLSSTFDELNKFFTISGMPVASGQYWNSIHGRGPGEAKEDAEGLQIMRTLARNMSFLMKSIQLGKETYGLPEKENPIRTNFIH